MGDNEQGQPFRRIWASSSMGRSIRITTPKKDDCDGFVRTMELYFQIKPDSLGNYYIDGDIVKNTLNFPNCLLLPPSTTNNNDTNSTIQQQRRQQRRRQSRKDFGIWYLLWMYDLYVQSKGKNVNCT